MSEERILENSTVASDSVVSLSKDDYRSMLMTIRCQNQKVQAINNLQQLIHSKDNELKSSQERVQNLQVALDRAEMRLVNQIRVAASKTSNRSTLEADSVAYEKDASEVRQVSPVKLNRPTEDDRGTFPPTSDIEMDGACSAEPSSLLREKDSSSSLRPLSSPPSSHKSGNFVRSSSPSTSFDDGSTDKQGTFQNRGPRSSVSSFPSVKGVDALTSLDATEKVSLSGNTSLKSFGAKGAVSKDLLDKLMHQNARLRKIIKDILDQRGTTIESHLESQETQDVVLQLREELRLSKTQNERLKQIINAKDGDDILKKYAEQSENFQKLKKTAAVLQTLVDSYGKEYEKLQQSNVELKERLSAAITKQKDAEVGECRESSMRMPTATAERDSVDLSLSCKSLNSQLTEVLGKLKATESECTSLKIQCQKQQERLQRHERENSEARQAKERCETLESDKQLLQSQIAVFQEDFTTEHKENLEKQQHYESTLAKHQDWIRRIVAEAQKLRSDLEGERATRQQAETSYHEIKARFHSFIAESRSSAAACRAAENSPPLMVTHHDLQVDHASEVGSSTSELCEEQGYAQQGNGQEDMLVCSRCEREFEQKDVKKFMDHVARCTDD